MATVATSTTFQWICIVFGHFAYYFKRAIFLKILRFKALCLFITEGPF